MKCLASMWRRSARRRALGGGGGSAGGLPISCWSRWMGAASTTRCSRGCSGRPGHPDRDVERIEVVRAPGRPCGANAVNGVINIVTRKATATRAAWCQWARTARAGGDDGGPGRVEIEGIGAMRVFAKGGIWALRDGRMATGPVTRRAAGSPASIDGEGAGWCRATASPLQQGASADLRRPRPQRSFRSRSCSKAATCWRGAAWGMAGGDATLQAYVGPYRCQAQCPGQTARPTSSTWISSTPWRRWGATS